MKQLLTGILSFMVALICYATPANKNVVTYRDFGAVGDGKTDDFNAIVKAHEYANEHNLPVRADDKAEYYIGNVSQSAIIRTNTNWGKARFIIDDTAAQNHNAQIFTVTSKLKSFTPKEMPFIKKNQTKLNIKLPQSCMFVVQNADIKRYIRYGVNANSGAPQTDIFIADRNGKIDMNAPVIWDFDKFTKITAYPIDSQILTVSGGNFTTIANQREGQHRYFSRGLAIRRSNTVLDGIKHHITGEGEQCWPYGGFIGISECANVTVKNTLLTGHKTYINPNAEGKKVSTGTYDIGVNRALNVTFANCSQTNDINNSTYWGIMGTNYSKNLILDSCIFSRFDAHMGVANATIRNSTLGHMGINAIGAGTFLVENSTVRGRTLINLRSDYGSTWNGDIIIRNCIFIPANGKKAVPVLIGGANNGQHDFGYACHMPTKIIIDGLEIKDNLPDNCNGPLLFANFNPQNTNSDYQEKFPYIITKTVSIRKLKIDSGKTLRLSDNPYLFRNVKITGIKL